MDQNLPGLARELALGCWHAVDRGMDSIADRALYRAIYGGMRTLLKAQVQANRYCGGARSCEGGLHPPRSAPMLAHEAYPGEHVRIYLLEPPYDFDLLVKELVSHAVRAVADRGSHPSPEALSIRFRSAVVKTLRNRVFESFPCGPSPLCGMNEPYDPWDLRDPINRLVPAGVS